MNARELWSAGQRSHALLTERLSIMSLHAPNTVCCIDIL